MGDRTAGDEAAAGGRVTRAVEVTLDPSRSQERWLRSYVGSMRAAYNWALAQARANLAVRASERERGVPDDAMTPAVSWSQASLHAAWRQVRDQAHPWHRDVSIHAFRTGLDNAAAALKNFSDSRAGRRRGRKVGFPTRTGETEPAPGHPGAGGRGSSEAATDPAAPALAGVA